MERVTPKARGLHSTRQHARPSAASPQRAHVPLVVCEAGERRRVARTQRELAEAVLVLGLHRAGRAVADDGVPLGDLLE